MQIDPALLRPGRFDCIIPVGDMDAQSRRTVFRHFLGKTHRGSVDIEEIVSRISQFTPADIELLFQKIKQQAFERELSLGEDYLVSTEWKSDPNLYASYLLLKLIWLQ